MIIVIWLIGWWITSFVCGYLEIYDLNDCEMLFVWPLVAILLLVSWMYIPLETLFINDSLDKMMDRIFKWIKDCPAINPAKFGKQVYDRKYRNEGKNTEDCN